MKQERKARQQAAIREEIKSMARAHMARGGAAALSLRAVAAEMGLSSAAIYYYYANRDALITDLIIDAFRALAAALRAADPGPSRTIDERLYAVMHAYRAWALAAPAAFELIFGAPIPGYQAPAEVTSPEARAALTVIGELFGAAYREGRLRTSLETAALPETLNAHILAWSGEAGLVIPPAVLVAMHQAWGLGHGLVALELNGQLQPTLGDPAAFYDHTLRWLLHACGLNAPSERSPATPALPEHKVVE